MTRGIIVFGPAGSGKTTLGRAVAVRLDYPYYDLDDYIWRNDTAIPYTQMRTRQEKIDLLMGDIIRFPNFVMAGSMDSFNAPFVPLFDLGVFLTAPADIRVARVTAREREEFGTRIEPGGDMHADQLKFIDMTRRYDTDGSPSHQGHAQWAATFVCPVLHMDGTLPIADNAAQVVEAYRTKPMQSP